MPEQLQNHRAAQAFKIVLLIVILAFLGWFAISFLFAAAKTIVILAIALVIAYFVIRLFLGTKKS